MIKLREGFRQNRDGFKGLQELLIDFDSKLSSHLESTRAMFRQEKEQRARDSFLPKRTFIMSAFEPPHYQADQIEKSNCRFENSGEWIFTDKRYKAWRDGKDPADAALYLNGQPGAGKALFV